VELWLERANTDFRVMEFLLAAESVPWGAVCFHARQAADKTLEALFDAAIAAGFDLADVAEECGLVEAARRHLTNDDGNQLNDV
jgi:HEPN domain-containing protein